jgi:hypothetical protein
MAGAQKSGYGIVIKPPWVNRESAFRLIKGRWAALYKEPAKGAGRELDQ